VLKTVLASVPVLVTRAAPTSMAVEIARKQNLILLTGVRKDGFYVAHGADRIILP